MSKVNSTYFKNGNEYDLNNLLISRQGTTSYKDVFFGCAGWQHGDQLVYVAIASLSEEEQKISGKKTFMFHLSKHDNPLSAAYHAMKFNEDRDNNVIKLRGVKTGSWECEIPEFQYEAIDSEENVARRSEIIEKHNSAKKVPELKIEDIREAANSTLRAEKGAYLPKIGGMKGAIEIREMVEGQKEFFRNVGDVIEMTTDLMIIRIAA